VQNSAAVWKRDGRFIQAFDGADERSWQTLYAQVAESDGTVAVWFNGAAREIPAQWLLELPADEKRKGSADCRTLPKKNRV